MNCQNHCFCKTKSEILGILPHSKSEILGILANLKIEILGNMVGTYQYIQRLVDNLVAMEGKCERVKSADR